MTENRPGILRDGGRRARTGHYGFGVRREGRLGENVAAGGRIDPGRGRVPDRRSGPAVGLDAISRRG